MDFLPDPTPLPPNAPSYTIGELAKEFDLTLRAIRFYEDQGMLTPARQGNLRLFSRRDRARLAIICRGKRLGFSLKNIRTFLELYDADTSRVEQMRFLLTQAQDRIKALQQQQKDLELTLDELRAIEKNLLQHLPTLERGQLSPAELRRVVP